MILKSEATSGRCLGRGFEEEGDMYEAGKEQV